MVDNYCDKKFFGKIGDKNGFSEDSFLTADENSELKLVSKKTFDIHSGLRCINSLEEITICENKEMRVRRIFKNFGVFRNNGVLIMD